MALINTAAAIRLGSSVVSRVYAGSTQVWPSGSPPSLVVRGALASYQNAGDNAWSVPLVDGAAVGDVAVVAVATDALGAGIVFLSDGADFLGTFGTTAGEHVVRMAIARVVLTEDDITAGAVSGTYSTFTRCIALAAVCDGGGAAVDAVVAVQDVTTSGAVSLVAPSADGAVGGVAFVIGIVNVGGNAPSFAFEQGDALVDTSGVIPGGTAYMHGAVASLALVDSTATGDIDIDATLSAPYWQGRGIAAQIVIAGT
ncbi:hypothetical protein ACQQ2N_12115 [Dokdonella sp. MW10]|uniref:hypothetical protein n=1 Tax=Dokdonella sp. MW10 TaxID=2992926 RepID=UPI003F7F0E56